jgi:hypothetical protein
MSKRTLAAAPVLPTAAPNIPYWTVKPNKRNTAKMADRARQKRLAANLDPLRSALEKAAQQ